MEEIRPLSIVTTPPGEVSPSRGIDSGNRPHGSGFLESLKEAIAQANQIQLDATEAVTQLMTGESHNVHQTMIALQKADISFQLMMQIRNKLVAAYEEIQRMQI
jgi:flagellar hook-basal body complex protein FliE